MTRRIGILGSTGSIGTQTLEVVRQYPDQFDVAALSTHQSVDHLMKQAKQFRPDKLGVVADTPCPRSCLTGEQALNEIARMDLDLLVVSVVGTIGLQPSLTALRNGTSVGLATKEVMVAGGPLINEARDGGGSLIPLDSEHHAVHQLLRSEPREEIKTIILTASGGPFRDREGDLSNVTPEEALDHPNWDMGPKITIDSATMMNKGLELIEARYLFDFEPDRVRAIIHPQSTVHALVEFRDHSTQAHLSVPDMKLTLQSALFHPDRRSAVVDALPFEDRMTLEFEPVDFGQFPAYALARDAMKSGGGAPAVLNAANEVAVEAFLEREIAFTDIPKLVEDTLGALGDEDPTSYDAIRSLETEARDRARAWMAKN